jgi:hypothetical protein
MYTSNQTSSVSLRNLRKRGIRGAAEDIAKG